MSGRSPDWIVIGAGFTGSALAYELRKQGFKVQLFTPEKPHPTATRYSYGGLAYWAATTPLMQQLCQEGREIHRQLMAELGPPDTEFRETHLLLTIPPDGDVAAIASQYQQFYLPPQVLTPSEAQAVEPLLNPDAIAGALKLPHAHIRANRTAIAYQQAFEGHGGEVISARVTGWWQTATGQIVGVKTAQQDYPGGQVVLCAGGWSQPLLAQLGLQLPLYFTHAEILQWAALPGQVRGVIMPAQLQRLHLERQAATLHPDATPAPILDLGIVQFRDGFIRLGQISRLCADLQMPLDAVASTQRLQQAAAQLLPQLDSSPGQYRRTVVSFSSRAAGLVGAIAAWPGLHLFNGFPNVLLCAPALARHFAQAAQGQPDAVMAQLPPL